MDPDYKKFILGDAISSEQRNFFNEFGFIHFKNFIRPDTVDLIVKASLEVQNKWIKGKVEKVNGVPIKYGVDFDGTRIVQRFAFINQHHSALAEFLRDPRFNVLLELVSPGARLGSEEKDGMVLNHYINGPGSKFSRMGWHVDGLRDIFYGRKLSPMFNVGIHLTNVTAGHGGLRIIPGTHNQSLFDLLFRKLHFLDHKPDKNELMITPSAGDLTIHDGRLWHRVAKSTEANEQSRRRVVYVPIISGEYLPKDENSPTLLYQRFIELVN